VCVARCLCREPGINIFRLAILTGHGMIIFDTAQPLLRCAVRMLGKP
jgi:hypothetical protein